jgi:hypothetical protein
MIPMTERLRLNKAGVRIKTRVYKTYRFQNSPDSVPAERVVAPETTTIDPRCVMLNETVPGTYSREPNIVIIPDELANRAEPVSEGRSQEFLQKSREAALYRDIQRRAEQGLRLEHELFGSEGSDTDSMPDSMPDLVPVYQSSDATDLGLCGLCFEEQHAATRDCPLYRPRNRADVGLQDPEETLPSEYICDVYFSPELTRNIEDGGLSAEMTHVLDIALGPTMTEWLSLPPEVMFRALTTAAREARQAFEEFTIEFDARRKEKEEEIIQGIEQEAVKALQDVMICSFLTSPNSCQ